MANHEADILLIRKYLNGELDARAMHSLEARALDDPFLADALEGYEKAGRNQQPAVAELSKRLQQRVQEKKVKRLIPFRTLAIAASILVVFTIGWLVFTKTKTGTQSPVIALKPVEKIPPAKPVAKETTVAAQMLAKAPAPAMRSNKVVKKAFTPIAGNANAAPVLAEPAADDNVIANTTAKKGDTADATPLNELVVMNYKPAKKSDASKDLNADKSTQYAANGLSEMRVEPLEQKLNSKAVGVSSSPADLKMSSAGLQKFFLQGRVIDEIDGRPLPGVEVKAYGTNFGAVTDRNGNFSIPSDGIRRGIVASRLGYNTAKVSADSSVSDSLKIISLAPADIPKEATLTNNANNRSAAHPQAGWSKYDRYLNSSSVSPDHQTGTVTLSFWVDKNGAISNVTVVTTLSDDADKKAIDLVKKGPKWIGNTNGKPEQVELAINF